MLPISLKNHRLVVQLPVAVTANLAQQGDGLLPKVHIRMTVFGTGAQNLVNVMKRDTDLFKTTTHVFFCRGIILSLR